jgi:hypothetical protein
MTSQEITQAGPRVQTIMHPSRHELRRLVREEKAAGRIGPNTSDIVPINVPGRQLPVYAVKVVRLADPAPRWKRRMWIGAGGVSTVTVLAAMVWHARHVLATGALTVTVIALALWLLANRASHSGACAGLHCAGCKG